MNALYIFCFVMFQMMKICTSRCPPPRWCFSTTVYCKRRGLRYVPNETELTVTVLYLEGNNISTFPSDAFNSLTSLTSLDLRSNQISTISNNAFNLVTSLTSLDLRSNQISTISSNAFNSLTSLPSLDLSFNQISTISSDAFKSLTSLDLTSIINIS